MNSCLNLRGAHSLRQFQRLPILSRWDRIDSLTLMIYIGSFFLKADLIEKKSENDFILFSRALMGGFIISIVTIFASALGAHLSGVLLAFPIAYVLISFNIHKEFGENIAIGVVYSAIFGTISLAVFCFVFAIVLQLVPLIYVLIISVIGSFFITALMLILQAKLQKHSLFLN